MSGADVVLCFCSCCAPSTVEELVVVGPGSGNESGTFCDVALESATGSGGENRGPGCRDDPDSCCGCGSSPCFGSCLDYGCAASCCCHRVCSPCQHPTFWAPPATKTTTAAAWPWSSGHCTRPVGGRMGGKTAHDPASTKRMPQTWPSGQSGAGRGTSAGGGRGREEGWGEIEHHVRTAPNNFLLCPIPRCL